MSTIKMVGLDLDGTALAPGGYFSDGTKAVFCEAMKKGVHIVVATGRTYHSLPSDLFDIEGIEFVVTSNGAKVYKIKNKELVYENCIDKESVLALADFFEERALDVEIFTDGYAYISRKEFEEIKAGRSRRDPGYVLSTRTPVDNIFEMMRTHSDNIENISINYVNDDIKAITEIALKKFENVTVTSSFSFNNEIGGKTTSKADGLDFLMNMLNLDRSNLMTAGDSLNDLAMIKHAEIGVAMENADSKLKEEADYITLSNSEDGVAEAIKKFVL